MRGHGACSHAPLMSIWPHYEILPGDRGLAEAVEHARVPERTAARTGHEANQKSTLKEAIQKLSEAKGLK
jgi:hypothetical protein